MSEILDHPVYYTELEGAFIAASVQRPWFAVTGGTIDDARERAQRALAFAERDRPTYRPARRTHELIEFAAIKVENLKAAERA